METFLRMQFQLLLRFMQLFVCLFVYDLEGDLKDCDWSLIWDESCLIMVRMQNCAHADACEQFFPAVADSLIRRITTVTPAGQLRTLNSERNQPELKFNRLVPLFGMTEIIQAFQGAPSKSPLDLLIFFFFYPLSFILLFHACEIVPVEFRHTLDNRAGSFLLS